MKSPTRWLAIDPGPEKSGYVVYEGGKVLSSGVLPNEEILCSVWRTNRLVIEMVQSYGMAVGKDTFETCVWIGRFLQALEDMVLPVRPAVRITRPEVMLHICKSPRAKPTNIRQALIDRLGPVGTKKNPGPLYGVESHAWAALALAVTADDLHGGKT